MESWSTSWSASGSAPEGRTPFGTALPAEFYRRPTLVVARELLGKVLVVRPNPRRDWDDPKAGVTLGRIVETEGYQGSDPASHSCRGQTPRNAVMFGEPGLAYIYFIYGMYEMLNFVTEPSGSAGAVLIRAVEPMGDAAMLARMRRRRKGVADAHLTNGPGRLCRAMGIRMNHRGASLRGPVFYVIDDGFRPNRLLESPRVGIRVGTDRYWRYFVEGSPWVSRAKQNAEARVLRGTKA